MRLNTQNKSRMSFLTNIEALSGIESSFYVDDEIDLHSSFYIVPVKSIATMPFVVTKNSSFVTVHYLTSLDNIQVKVVKDSGQTVYLNCVNPVAGKLLHISLAGFASGGYTVVFTNAAGNNIYGYFKA
jgi:hypothetical protein